MTIREAWDRVKSRVEMAEHSVNNAGIWQKYYKSLDGINGLTIATSLGALNYILCGTLGSGSYADMTIPFIANALYWTILIIVIFNSGLFIYTALVVFDNYFDIKTPTREVPSSFNLWIRWLWLVAIPAVIFLIAFTSVALLFSDGESRTRGYLVILGLVSLLLTILFTYLILDTIETAAKGLLPELIFAFAIFFIASGVWLNVYRDAQKEALITDSQYCYWLRSAYENPAKEGQPMPIEEQRFKFDRACIGVEGKQIKLDAYKTVPTL